MCAVPSSHAAHACAAVSATVVHLGRHPKPKDLIGRTLYALGGMMRGLGSALDSIGTVVQGPYAKEDQRERPLNSFNTKPCLCIAYTCNEAVAA